MNAPAGLEDFDVHLDMVESMFVYMADMTGQELQHYRDTFAHAAEFWPLLFDVLRSVGAW